MYYTKHTEHSTVIAADTPLILDLIITSNSLEIEDISCGTTLDIINYSVLEFDDEAIEEIAKESDWSPDVKGRYKEENLRGLNNLLRIIN